MRAVEIRDELFKDLIVWLKTKKGILPDKFSMDVWMLKSFDMLYQEYVEEKKRDRLAIDVVTLFNSTEIEKLLNHRKLLELKQREQAELDKKRIIESKKAAQEKETIKDEEQPIEQKEVVEEQTEEVPGEDVENPTPEEAKEAADAMSGVTDIPQNKEETKKSEVLQFPKKRKKIFGLF